VSATILQACGVPLDSTVAPQVPAAGASTSSVLSLLTGYQNQMPVVTSAGLSSFGASSPRRALDGGMRRLDVPYSVVPSAQREVVVSGDILVKMFHLPLAPIRSVNPPKSLEGDHRAA